MRKLFAIFLLAFSIALPLSVAPSFSTDASAATCYSTNYTPYVSGGNKVVGSASFYCDRAGYKTYRTCLQQDYTLVSCYSHRTTANSYSRSQACYLNGTAGPAKFRTYTEIYDANGNFLTWWVSNNLYYNRCI